MPPHHPTTYRVSESTRFLVTILSFGFIFTMVTIIYDYMNYRQELSLLQESQATVADLNSLSLEYFDDSEVGIRFEYPSIFGTLTREVADRDTLDEIQILDGKQLSYHFNQEFQLAASVMSLDYQDSGRTYGPWEIKSFLSEDGICRTNWGNTLACQKIELQDGGYGYAGTTHDRGQDVYVVYVPLTEDPNLLTFVFYLHEPNETNIRILKHLVGTVRRV